ncbi:hypothetical protein [Stenotrophomonas indicatrix]|uniref:hypothetical protein n=1 Tax=Stenotrophomonas indicatrix TaxID=2045451 RepID=UPI0028A1E6ED|nr:hypothetical protein [Stenotrophomonas indicatrix]
MDIYVQQGVKKADGFVQVAAAFSFSMMGFMAAVMALFSVLGQSRALKKYKSNGLLRVLLIGIAITLFELAMTFIASLQLFVVAPNHSNVKCVALALLGSLGMVIATSIPMIGLQIRSAGEK